MRLRKLALLFLILGFGAAVETAYSLKTRLAIGPMGCRVLTGRFQGPSYSFETEEAKDGLPQLLLLDVENAFGEVRVWKGEPGRVKLRLREVVYLPTEEQARALAGNLKPRLALEGNTLRVTTNRRELEQTSDVGLETHFSIEVPPLTRVKIQNEHGAATVSDAAEANVWSSYEPVRVERVAGPVQIDSRHGDVAAEGLGGTLKLYSRHGNVELKDVAEAAHLTVEHGQLRALRVGGIDATLAYSDLTAESVRGELLVRGRHAGVKASDVGGRALVETSYRDVELHALAGDARVKAEHGGLKATGVKGALFAEVSYDDVVARDVGGHVEARVSHGGFRGEGLKLGARVWSSGDDVVLSGFEGPVEIESQRGGVRLSPAKPVRDAIVVTTSRGGIRLGVPPGSSFELDASAGRGEVQLDLPDATVTESSSSRVKARLGQGGKLVTLRTQHGDIAVETRAAQASTQ
jgi:DUF4097 and DUF4098 domain-containing protein YvlB